MEDLQTDTSVEFHDEETDNPTSSKPRINLVVIPVIPKSLAVFCLVSNIIVPGSGTIVSAFSVFCFYHKKETFQRMVVICMSNVAVGTCQLISVIFILIGWIWSIIWGCAIVGHSRYYERDKHFPSPVAVQPAEMSKSLSANRPSSRNGDV